MGHGTSMVNTVGHETTRIGHGTSMVNTVGLRLPEWNIGHHGQHSGT